MLKEEEINQIKKLYDKLLNFRTINAEKRVYYEGKNRVKDLGISVPPELRNVTESVGWAKIAVDSLSDRVCLEGFVSDSVEGLNDVFDANNLMSNAKMAHIDSFIYGTGFVVCGRGDTMIGEPEVLVSIESPNSISTNFNLRKRRVDSAIHVYDFSKEKRGIYFTENEVIPFTMIDGFVYEDINEDRHEHGFGRVPIVQIINNGESGSTGGHSEITEPIKAIINSVIRTLLGVEIMREFTLIPSKYVLGADAEMFEDADGNMRSPHSVAMDRVLTLPSNENGTNPVVGQFAPGTGASHLEMLDSYSKLFAAEASLPHSYLGMDNAGNLTSADAIKASESRLIKKAEDRIASVTQAWVEVAKLIVLIRDGEIPSDFVVEPQFKEPATPTRGATADEMVKYVQGGILLPDSEVVYRRMNLSRSEIAILKKEKMQRGTDDILASLIDGNKVEDMVI